MPERRTYLSVLPNFACLVVVLWGISQARDFLIPLLLAGLLAFALSPAVRFLRRWRLPEWASVLVTALLVLVPLGSLVYLAVSEAQSLARDWPKIQASVTETSAQLAESPWAQRFHLAPVLDPSNLGGRIGASAGGAAKLALGGLMALLSSGFTMLLVIAFAVMMLAARLHLQRGAKQLVSMFKNHDSEHLVDETVDLVQTYLRARFGLTLVTAAAGGVVMMAFGIRYALMLGLFYGLLTWIPVVGMFIALAPPVSVGLASGKSGGAMVALVAALVLVWAIQDHVLTPKWLGGRLKLNFFATYIGLFAGAQLWGPWGMILSVPFLGVLRIVFAASDTLKPVAFLISEDANPASVPTPRRKAS